MSKQRKLWFWVSLSVAAIALVVMLFFSIDINRTGVLWIGILFCIAVLIAAFTWITRTKHD